ncbi:MAG TPA: hypothetical protein VIK45_17745, partial [Candidatus Dormibacteraeota bacterium]
TKLDRAGVLSIGSRAARRMPHLHCERAGAAHLRAGRRGLTNNEAAVQAAAAAASRIPASTTSTTSAQASSGIPGRPLFRPVFP